MDITKCKETKINPNAKRLKPELLWFGEINELGSLSDNNDLEKGETEFKQCVGVREK